MKWNCENYLSEDYRLKSGTTIWILTLRKLSAFQSIPVSGSLQFGLEFALDRK
jgi:hypothetical protein